MDYTLTIADIPESIELAFKKYLKSNGVKEYIYFSKCPTPFVPSNADYGEFIYETYGKGFAAKYGIVKDISGTFIIDGVNCGQSVLSLGKFNRNLTVQLILEDIGQLSVGTYDLRREYDAIFGEGWFDKNVYNQVTTQLLLDNRERELKEMKQVVTRKHRTKFEVFVYRLKHPKEVYHNIRVKLYWKKHAFMKWMGWK